MTRLWIVAAMFVGCFAGVCLLFGLEVWEQSRADDLLPTDDDEPWTEIDDRWAFVAYLEDVR